MAPRSGVSGVSAGRAAVMIETRNRWTILLLCLCIAGMFFLCLRPKGMSFYNQVSGIEGKPGLRFGRYGIAQAAPSFRGVQASDEPQSFTIEMAIQPDRATDVRFRSILTLFDGLDETQLVIGQWQSSIIAMNGDDYDGRKGYHRIFRTDVLSSDKTQMITITSGESGSSIYIDGLQIKHKDNLRLSLPGGDNQAVLILGNCTSGKCGWIGDMYGLAIYPAALPASVIVKHYRQWAKNGVFDFDKQVEPSLVYTFQEQTGEKIPDRTSNGFDLTVPRIRKSLKPQLLLIPWYTMTPELSDAVDFVINVGGFLPLGFLLMAVFSDKKGPAVLSLSPAVSVTLACFAFSLMIEITQAYMPSRSSQVLDLAANTLGGYAGIVAWRFVAKRRQQSMVV